MKTQATPSAIEYRKTLFDRGYYAHDLATNWIQQ